MACWTGREGDTEALETRATEPAAQVAMHTNALLEISPAKLRRAAEVIALTVAPDRSMLAEDLLRYAAILDGTGEGH